MNPYFSGSLRDNDRTVKQGLRAALGAKPEIRNPKSERGPKPEIRIWNAPAERSVPIPNRDFGQSGSDESGVALHLPPHSISKPETDLTQLWSIFRPSDFEFLSDFGFRPSDFDVGTPAPN
jgi:hypothetical protein